MVNFEQYGWRKVNENLRSQTINSKNFTLRQDGNIWLFNYIGNVNGPLGKFEGNMDDETLEEMKYIMSKVSSNNYQSKSWF